MIPSTAKHPKLSRGGSLWLSLWDRKLNNPFAYSQWQ